MGKEAAKNYNPLLIVVIVVGALFLFKGSLSGSSIYDTPERIVSGPNPYGSEFTYAKQPPQGEIISSPNPYGSPEPGGAAQGSGFERIPPNCPGFSIWMSRCSAQEGPCPSHAPECIACLWSKQSECTQACQQQIQSNEAWCQEQCTAGGCRYYFYGWQVDNCGSTEIARYVRTAPGGVPSDYGPIALPQVCPVGVVFDYISNFCNCFLEEKEF